MAELMDPQSAEAVQVNHEQTRAGVLLNLGLHIMGPCRVQRCRFSGQKRGRVRGRKRERVAEERGRDTKTTDRNEEMKRDRDRKLLYQIVK